MKKQELEKFEAELKERGYHIGNGRGSFSGTEDHYWVKHLRDGEGEKICSVIWLVYDHATLIAKHPHIDEYSRKTLLENPYVVEAKIYVPETQELHIWAKDSYDIAKMEAIAEKLYELLKEYGDGEG